MNHGFRYGIIGLACLILAGCSVQQKITAVDYQRAEKLREEFGNKVFKKTIEPTWFDEGQKFWYRNDLKDGKEFILVNVEKAIRTPAFDHQRLAESLSMALAKSIAADKLPFEQIEIFEDGKVLQFDYEKRQWRFNLENYECLTPGGIPLAEQLDQRRDDSPRPRRRSRQRREGRPVSPDRLWQAVSRDWNLYLKSTQDDQEFRLTQDGDPNHFYDRPSWSPDGKVIVAYQIRPGDNKEVYRIESSPKEGGRAKLHTSQYALPGDKYDILEMNLFFADTKEQIKADVEPWDAFGMPRLRWAKDSTSFTFERPYRHQQRLCVIRVDAKTGKSQVLIDERSDTFVNINYNPVEPNYLDDSSEIIWSSERDGWRHLYLYDSQAGQLKNQITKGDWVVRGLDRVDAANRVIYFRASGMDADLDPYFIKYYRINFDGSNLICLTPGPGTHTARFSSDWKYLIDTWSTVQQPPIHELRSTQTGALVCELEKADASELFKAGCKTPEPFVAKGRDGKTDIWGIIVRPLDFDKSKKYPVIEDIYAGPQDSFVPKAWRDFFWHQALAEMGFIVVQIDGMGTMNRSKAFHDVTWKNLGDHGLPDRIAWIKAAAKEYPYMDISRVGIYGTSAGGQSAAAALLFHPQFYKVAVASCGCHDNLMDKSYWNEQWMGYPVGPHYVEQSNITNAAKLQGHLMLIVGEMDDNVPPESTYRFADALIKAKKDFELVVLPGAGHTSGEWFGGRKRMDFFVRHLLDQRTPDWNEIIETTTEKTTKEDAK